MDQMDQMDHGAQLGTGSAGIDAVALLLRLVLLFGSAVVAGVGLLRPLVGAVGRRLTVVVAALAGISAVLAIVSILTVGANVVGAVVHAALAVAIAGLLPKPGAARWPAAALVVLVVIETALGSSGIDFAVDTVFVAGATVWLGITALSLGVAPQEWRGSSLRLGPLAITLGGLLVLAGGTQLALSGIGFDRRLYGSAFGVALLAILVLALVATVVAAVPRADPGRTYRFGAAAIAIGFLAWSALAAIPKPPELPVPGVPLLASVSVADQDVPVLVSPQRPGRNLVHVPATAGEVSVAVEGGQAVRATARPGAEGSWAEVDLPDGRSDLVLTKDDSPAKVEVDAGTAEGAASAAGSDGPECAAAALGGLLNNRRTLLTACPSDALSDDDADALRKLVGFLAERRAPVIDLVADETARGAAAAKVVREAAARKNIPVAPGQSPDGALVVVSGWDLGYRTMRDAATAQREKPAYGYGLYAAPWLLHGPIVNLVASSSIPLRFDPREQLAVSYAVTVGNGFGGESPSVAGFRNWLGDQWRSVSGEVQIFASAQVNAMPMYPNEPHPPGMVMARDYRGQWVPEGTVVPVSVPLKS
ncbi:hypothetical protein [Amycolatopsis minnesotensis]